MRPKGIVRLFRRGAMVWECENLFVNTGLPPLANLIAGVTAGQFVTALGYGSGAVAPTLTDTALGATPAYYNANAGHSFPSSGSVQFNYSLLTTDYGAVGITIQELGLFANSTAAGLPAATGTTSPAWTASTAETVGNLVVDANGNLQRCTASGTTGATVPTWPTALNATTTDGGVTWTLSALHAPPGPMIAHVVVPAFAYTGAGNYSGTWTLIF
jgi:hypothetical protein